MKIEPIIYETTRGIYSVEDKLSIAALFLFCWKLGSETFSELLYTDDVETFINNLSDKYIEYEININVNLDNKNVKDALLKTIEVVIDKYDSNGYLKAVYNKDAFALVIQDIINYDFSSVVVKAKAVNKQLKLLF